MSVFFLSLLKLDERAQVQESLKGAQRPPKVPGAPTGEEKLAGVTPSTRFTGSIDCSGVTRKVQAKEELPRHSVSTGLTRTVDCSGSARKVQTRT